jgi:hypothetical protein
VVTTRVLVAMSILVPDRAWCCPIVRDRGGGLDLPEVLPGYGDSPVVGRQSVRVTRMIRRRSQTLRLPSG